MGRYCSQCGQFENDYSNNQWAKGEGQSRCRPCVDEGQAQRYSRVATPYFGCATCGREFGSQNEVNMHMQVHRPKEVACPICGDRRFGSGANAVQHVESGSCTGCRGQANARDQIYKYASAKGQMQQFISTPMLEYQGYTNTGTPEFPYHCQPCNKKFRQMSQLLQHQDQKHNNLMALTNY
ncbi:zinc finger protein [Fragilaria crotonensis]|nr:zinc finger protein [Fragilaria crotonensis]